MSGDLVLVVERGSAGADRHPCFPARRERMSGRFLSCSGCQMVRYW